MDLGDQADEAWLLNVQCKLYQWSRTDPEDSYGLTHGQRATVLNEKKRIYEQEEQGIKIVPGAIEFVRWRLSIIVWLLQPRQRRAIEMTNLNRLGIAELFEAVVDLRDVSEPKPSPEIYLTVTSRLALQPSQCMIVEDALTGVLSAKRAGCRVSALTRTFAAHELLGVGADFIFEDFQSLKCLLRSRSSAVTPGSLSA
jgi:beta-phosphoglucomutase-like phosphatase (HAD superfamily)